MIITNEAKDEGLKVTDYIRRYLESHGKDCSVRLVNHGEETIGDIQGDFGKTDCVLVLGGDGTLLRAAVELPKGNIPLLGVNLGMLGYLAEVDAGNLEETLRRLMEGEYERERRMMLQGEVLQEGQKALIRHALNDIVVARAGSLQIIRLKLYVNGQLLNEYQADGIIVSTPTGSTGYNMSAGGPIVEPCARLIVLTPICPHTPGARSIVLASEDTVVIEIAEGKQGQVQEVEASFDGSRQITLKTGDRIVIRRSEQETEIIKMSKVSFLETLHKKMSGA